MSPVSAPASAQAQPQPSREPRFVLSACTVAFESLGIIYVASSQKWGDLKQSLDRNSQHSVINLCVTRAATGIKSETHLNLSTAIKQALGPFSLETVDKIVRLCSGLQAMDVWNRELDQIFQEERIASQ